VPAGIEREVLLQSELHTHALHLVLHRAEGERLRLTVRDLVQEVARECQKRIENYKELQKKNRGHRRRGPRPGALDARAEKMIESAQTLVQRNFARSGCGM
jgi:hypothetical protein